jgi:nucleotide-binding universal stress UspA family protein
MKEIKDTQNILVPTDFTSVADNAVSYANEMAKRLEKGVSLLHVVESGLLSSKGSVVKHTQETSDKLKSMSEENNANNGVNTDYLVKPGNIFDTIGETADEIDSTMVVMGTHGIKGMQAITGSRALKVITHSNVPFVVVQNKKWSGIDNILVPIDFTKEDKQKLRWAGFLGKTFGSKVHLLAKQEKDEFVKNKVDHNVAYAKNFFKHNGIETEVHESQSSDYFKETIRTASQVDADLIVIMTDPETNLTDYVFGPYEQKVIANDGQIPVMCINSQNVYSVGGNVFSYTA